MLGILEPIVGLQESEEHLTGRRAEREAIECVLVEHRLTDDGQHLVGHWSVPGVRG